MDHGGHLQDLVEVYTRLADRIITTGEAIRALLLRDLPLAPERVVSIPTGIDLARFDPARVSGETVRQSLGLIEAEVVGMLSVLRSWKGHARFVEAFPAVLARRPAAHLVLAGEGPQRAAIRDGETGLLVPVGDDTALADRVARLLEDRDLGARLAGAGEALVRRAFGLDAMLDRVEAVYREAIMSYE